MERLENGQDAQQLRRRALPADASQSTTPAFPRSHALGLTGSETSPKTRESCSDEPTPNGYHDNGSANGPTARGDAPQPPPLPTAFDLRHVVYPLPRRAGKKRRRRDLPHFPAVVNFVYENRYADRSQIQRRFAHRMATVRAAQYHLESLVSLGYLAVALVRGRAPQNRYVYFVTKRGLRMLQEPAEITAAK